MGYTKPYNVTEENFKTTTKNFTYIDGPSAPNWYLKLENNTFVFFNGATGYYIRFAEGCYENFYQQTDFDEYPFQPRYNDENEKYNLPKEVYFIQQVKSNGQKKEPNKMDNNTLLKQFANCDLQFEDIPRSNTRTFMPKDITICQYMYVINDGETVTSRGSLLGYPLEQMYVMYNMIEYIQGENTRLEDLENAIPFWGDFSSESDWSKENLTELTRRLNLISEIQENLSYEKQNIEKIVIKDYQDFATQHHLNESEIMYRLLPRFIYEQDRLLQKNSIIENKLKLAQDMHKDLISICIEKEAYDEAINQNKESNGIQWIAIIMAILVPITVFYLENLEKNKKEYSRKSWKWAVAILLSLLAISLIVVQLDLTRLFNFYTAILLLPLLIILLLVFTPLVGYTIINDLIDRTLKDEYLELLVPTALLVILFSTAFIISSSTYPELFKKEVKETYLPIISTAVLLSLCLVYLALVKKLNARMIQNKTQEPKENSEHLQETSSQLKELNEIQRKILKCSEDNNSLQMKNQIELVLLKKKIEDINAKFNEKQNIKKLQGDKPSN